ncbi:hypothetical protein COU19_03085 [Candidatus Kaiserbacteria bacterium CG10_big_fil_rev_8_21_14_0_10_56_12]|uniref:Uncharacterized protein n=1 Tax=Candidatus Kaiserbacteria bacterium CG10_big_fil_rev_8_21_14_0_10_56_12 TaxID=1974611 RepID=A0A2H0U972_9BACT|nr:MAG: hypothetical protein COU19_03085 [Candidatus Kaiserbacteria bacterium CG10_big_fil_rev_8_21_14_0_10_56_12]
MQDELSKQIATDLGISDLPVEKQQELIAEFGQQALQAATASVLEKLSEPLREEFLKLSEAGDAEGLKKLLDKEVPDHDEIAKKTVAEEVERFKSFGSE